VTDRRRQEWERALAERATARAALVAALERLDARARDPLGLKEAYRRHPYVFAGVAAGAGALLGGLLAPGPKARAEEPGREPRGHSDPLLDALRDALVDVATPWITGFVEEHLAGPRPSASYDDSAAPQT
jgi:hypothetical protein